MPTQTILRRAPAGSRAPHRARYATLSPDILPLGPLPPPDAAADLLADFDTDLSRPLTLNAANQIYLRGVNGFAQDSGFEARLFYAPPTAIPWPDLFLDNVVPASQAVPQRPVPAARPGLPFVVPEPFQLAAGLRTASLLAAVTARGTPDLRPERPLRGATELVDYYDARPGVAVRSVVVVPVGPGPAWRDWFAFESRDIDGPVHALVQTRGMSVGWGVSLHYLPSGAAEPLTLIPPTRVNAPDTALDAVLEAVPGMTGRLVLTVDANSVAPAPGWRVEVSLGIAVEVRHPHFARAFSHEYAPYAHAAPGRAPGEPAGAARTLEIGGFAFMAQRNGAL
jgi:hypothetical protein